MSSWRVYNWTYRLVQLIHEIQLLLQALQLVLHLHTQQHLFFVRLQKRGTAPDSNVASYVPSSVCRFIHSCMSHSETSEKQYTQSVINMSHLLFVLRFFAVFFCLFFWKIRNSILSLKRKRADSVWRLLQCPTVYSFFENQFRTCDIHNLGSNDNLMSSYKLVNYLTAITSR